MLLQFALTATAKPAATFLRRRPPSQHDLCRAGRNHNNLTQLFFLQQIVAAKIRSAARCCCKFHPRVQCDLAATILPRERMSQHKNAAATRTAAQTLCGNLFRNTLLLLLLFSQQKCHENVFRDMYLLRFGKSQQKSGVTVAQHDHARGHPEIFHLPGSCYNYY